MSETAPHIGIIHDDLHELLFAVELALKKKGARVDFLPQHALSAEVFRGAPKANWSDFDVLFLDRAGEKSPAYATQLRVLDQLEQSGLKIMNCPRAYELARDKAASLLRLSAAGFLMPRTRVVFRMIDFSELPFDDVVAKPPLGHSGLDVLAFSAANPPMESLETLLVRHGSLVIQEFIANPLRRDLRLDIVNGKVQDALYRCAVAEDRKSVM